MMRVLSSAPISIRPTSRCAFISVQDEWSGTISCFRIRLCQKWTRIRVAVTSSIKIQLLLFFFFRDYYLFLYQIFPDIVIHDRISAICTDCLETNILNAHTRKAEKYSHLIPEITSANVKVIPFEVGSCGFISPDNKTSLKLLFKYCSKETT